MAYSVMSFFTCSFFLLSLLTSIVSAAAIDVSLDSRALKCDASAVSLIKTQITHPYYFCTWYKSSVLPRTRSPLPALDAVALNLACDCVIASGQPVHLQSNTASPSSSVCQASDLTLVKSEYKDPKSFCTFFNAAARPDAPVPGQSAKTLQKACACYLNPAPSSTSSSTSKSTALCSSTAIAGLKSAPSAQSFCSSFMRSTVSAVSTATSTSIVTGTTSASTITTTTVKTLTSTTIVGKVTKTTTTLYTVSLVQTSTVTAFNATVSVEATVVATETDVYGYSMEEFLQRAKRTVATTSAVPTPSAWTGFAKAQLSNACGCILPSATLTPLTTYTSTTTKIVPSTVFKNPSAASTPVVVKTVTTSIAISQSSTVLVTVSKPTTPVTLKTTVTKLAATTISLKVPTTATTTTSLTLDGKFCTAYLGYKPSTVTLFATSVASTSATTTSATIVVVSKRGDSYITSPVLVGPLATAQISAACSSLATGAVTATSTICAPTLVPSPPSNDVCNVVGFLQDDSNEIPGAFSNAASIASPAGCALECYNTATCKSFFYDAGDFCILYSGSVADAQFRADSYSWYSGYDVSCFSYACPGNTTTSVTTSSTTSSSTTSSSTTSSSTTTTACTPSATIVSSPPSGDVCGASGYVTSDSYVLDYVSDAASIGSAAGCALTCSNNPSCASFFFETGSFCGLLSASSSAAGFYAASDGTPVYDLSCFSISTCSAPSTTSVTTSSTTTSSTTTSSATSCPTLVTSPPGGDFCGAYGIIEMNLTPLEVLSDSVSVSSAASCAQACYNYGTSGTCQSVFFTQGVSCNLRSYPAAVSEFIVTDETVSHIQAYDISCYDFSCASTTTSSSTTSSSSSTTSSTTPSATPTCTTGFYSSDSGEPFRLTCNTVVTSGNNLGGFVESDLDACIDVCAGNGDCYSVGYRISDGMCNLYDAYYPSSTLADTDYLYAYINNS